MAVTEDAVHVALDTLRPSLDADGFDIYLDSVTIDGKVVVILEARPGACLECLVPEELLIQMIDSAIRKRSASLSQVELLRKGFEQ